MAEWIKKRDSPMCFVKETHFKYNNTGWQKVNGQKKLYCANLNQRNARVAELILHKVGFRARKLPEMGGHYITVIKGSVH